MSEEAGTIFAGGGPEDPVTDALAFGEAVHHRRVTRKTPGKTPGTSRTETSYYKNGQRHRTVTTRRPIESDSGGTETETVRIGPYNPPAAQGDGSQPGKQAQSASGPSMPNINIGGGTSYHRWVIAEFIACVILTGATPLLSTPKDAQGNDVAAGSDILFGADALVRLSALSAVFFILGLLANHEKSGKFAAAFGGLITTALLINTSPDFWTKIGSMFSGQVGSGQQKAESGGSSGGSGSGSGGSGANTLSGEAAKLATEEANKIFPGLGNFLAANEESAAEVYAGGRLAAALLSGNAEAIKNAANSLGSHFRQTVSDIAGFLGL